MFSISAKFILSKCFPSVINLFKLSKKVFVDATISSAEIFREFSPPIQCFSLINHVSSVGAIMREENFSYLAYYFN